jgi:hypothetical protein
MCHRAAANDVARGDGRHRAEHDDRRQRGRSNADLDRTLFLAETTVTSRVAHIPTRLDLRDRVQIVIYAYEHCLI